MSVERHYFPGNNTPVGFYSYYDQLLTQREAQKMIYIKGGPGTGKSTFFKAIGETLVQNGNDVDFLHCSADCASLDGILLPRKQIAFLDGTSPHVLDPKTPGAVDEIINFGEYWDQEALGKYKVQLIELQEAYSQWYCIGYGYLNAAKAIQEQLGTIQANGIEEAELHMLAADIVKTEFAELPLTLHSGSVRKAFSSAITPAGIVDYTKTLLKTIKNIYLIHVPEGYENRRFMQQLMGAAIYRGLDVEVYHCPMAPEEKIEHILIPSLSLALITVNCWHNMEPWELFSDDGEMKNLTLLDIKDYQSLYYIEKNAKLVNHLKKDYAALIEQGIGCFEKAKELHDQMEKVYIPHMNYASIEKLTKKYENF